MRMLETLDNIISSKRDVSSELYAEDVERLVAKLLWRDEERKNPTLYELSKREEDREKLREDGVHAVPYFKPKDIKRALSSDVEPFYPVDFYDDDIDEPN